VTPVLERFYNEAADAYAQACLQYVHTMINYVRQLTVICSNSTVALQDVVTIV